MSAKIYSPPKHIKKPEFNWKDVDGSLKSEDDYIKKLSNWCKQEYAPTQDKKYIGETIKFPVADSHALYMVASLKPLELLHVPVGDEWTYRDADLQTVQRVKQSIDADRKWNEFAKTQCKVGEVNDFLDEFATEVYDMPEHALELLMDDHICVKWPPRDKEYFVPKNNSFYGEQGEKVYNYLNRSFHV
jgi:hypothetical protein